VCEFGGQLSGEAFFDGIQITDRQNVDIGIADIKM
jgi:hypothetical protein